MQHAPKTRYAWLALVTIVIVWPPIYTRFVHPHLLPKIRGDYASTGELKNLLDARRYTITVPEDKDGYYLSFECTVDGKTKTTGGTQVKSGMEIVLLIRRDSQSKNIEYCWITDSIVVRGTFDDPLAQSGTSSERPDGSINDEDWILRGGRESVQVTPAGEPAEFELRLVFVAPNHFSKLSSLR